MRRFLFMESVILFIGPARYMAPGLRSGAPPFQQILKDSSNLRSPYGDFDFRVCLVMHGITKQ
jgi:hypothetical protein